MSEDTDKESKTEEASEKKVNDAIEKGNVPVSREAAIFASLLGILVSLSFFAGPQTSVLADELARLVDDPGGFRLDGSEDATALLDGSLMAAARFLLPIVVVLALAGLASSFLQNTPRLVGERIRPQWSRVSPMAGWKRIFATQGQVEFGKSVFKFGAITAVCMLLLFSEQDRVVGAVFSDPVLLPGAILALATRLISAVCVATIVLVCLDLVWTRLNWKNELKMTKQEVKEEFKQSEGDPLVKARMRSLAQQRARNRMMSAVPRASVVIANPTHYAIALHYDRQKGGAPLVLAKGTDLIALKIREIAESNGIPVVEDKPLARAMYDAVEVDQWIPPEFYKPVAMVLYYVFSRGKDAKP
jgi:flagellar biosynthesis protein FlhB